MKEKEIIMKSPVYIVKEITSKTRAKGLEGVKIGTKIQFVKKLERAGIGAKTTYAPILQIINLDTGEKSNQTFNTFGKVIRGMILEEETKEQYGYGVCGICNSGIIWQCDYDFSDYGLEGEGVVGCGVCSGCEAEVEFRKSDNTEVKDE